MSSVPQVIQPGVAGQAMPVYRWPSAGNPAAFEQLVQQRELPLQVANDLAEVMPRCKVIMVCDDSTSMRNVIAEEAKVGQSNQNAFAQSAGLSTAGQKMSTRWLELQKIAAILVEFIVALCPQGLDLVFFNRAGITDATSMAQMAHLFNDPPSGGTPMGRTFREIFRQVEKHISAKQLVLVLVVSDGCPSDVSHEELLQILQNKHDNIHVSMVECTDEEEDMSYLDRFDNLVKNFDNTDDYREEVARIQATQGSNFRFNRNDYVAKILLATFVKYYFNLDQTRVGNNNYYNNNGFSQNNNNNQSCCRIQ